MFLYDPANLSLIVGLGLLGLDIIVIGLSPVMFLALGALASSALLYASGWRPALLETAALWAAAGLTIAIFGKRPLQSFQNADVQEDRSSDLIGRELVTTHEVTKTQGLVHWSGVEWRARLAEDVETEKVAPGARMKVVKIDNLALVLKPVIERLPQHRDSEERAPRL
jgi:membrane protein implicated in regulation of membrane protease activity